MTRPPSRAVALATGLASRAGFFLATVCGAAALVLVLLWAAPGDPIDLLPDPDELRPVLEQEWGLDRPLPARLAGWLAAAAQGDLGTSLTYRPGAPVAEVIAGPALRSLGWAMAALLVALLGGTALAGATAGRASWLRPLALVVSIGPLFLLAHLSVHLLNETAFWAMGAGYIDRPGWFALPDQASTLRTALAITLLAVGSGALADVHAEVEESLARLRASPFVEAARARGAPTWPHVALNLLPALASVATSRAAFFLGGLVILEKVLLLNGVGAILWRAAELRDYNLALGITVVLAATVAALRLGGDALRLFLDPRLSADVR